MKRKPKGRKYANLVRRGRAIYYQRMVDGRRTRQSLDTDDWDVAAATRDAIERRLGTARVPGVSTPSFAEAAADALAVMEAYIEAGAEAAVAASTARDLRRMLGKDGPLCSHFGEWRLDAIDPAALRAWYDREIVGRKLSAKSGDNYLSAIERVLRHARNRGQIAADHKPVSIFAEQMRSERRTKAARAAKDKRSRRARDGVLTPDQVGALVAAAEANGLEDFVTILLAAECGMRRGEVSGLTWGAIHWGQGADDPARAIEVKASNSSGLGTGSTKHGKARRPHMSRRLRSALRALWVERGQPGPEVRVIRRDYFDLSKLTLARALKRAGLPSGRTFQNLRATCGSLLRVWGVASAYARVAIGHEGEAVADAHYNRLDFTTYRAPETLGEGEVPADLFARLCKAPEKPAKLRAVKGARR